MKPITPSKIYMAIPKEISIVFLVLVVFASCKKREINSSWTSLEIKKKLSDSAVSGHPTARTATLYFKCDLTDMGNGIYQGNFTNSSIYPAAENADCQGCNPAYVYFSVFVTVSNIDNYGNQGYDGEPFFGSLTVDNSSDAEVIKQPNPWPESHFAIKQGTLKWDNGLVNWTGYNSAFNTFSTNLSNWLTIKANYPDYTQPRPSAPFIYSYLPTTGGGAGWRTITGKLVRSNTGSGYAIASEDYPITIPVAGCPNANGFYNASCQYCIDHPDDAHCP